MSFLGIGPMELIFIIIIMILVLGPKNMVTTAQKLGVTLRKIVKSPMWATVMDTSREIREIPTRLIRDAGIEEDIKTIRSTTESIKNAGNVTVPYDISTAGKTKDTKKTETKKIDSENENLTESPPENEKSTASEPEKSESTQPETVLKEVKPEEEGKTEEEVKPEVKEE